MPALGRLQTLPYAISHGADDGLARLRMSREPDGSRRSSPGRSIPLWATILSKSARIDSRTEEPALDERKVC